MRTNEEIKKLEKQIENLKKEEQILKLEKQIHDLQKVEKLYFEAYNLQNSANVILNNHYKIDDECNFLNDDFYKITWINNTLQTRKLIDKLIIELETLKK